jgi:uncharacterized membrane protein YhaH (DUF805 family)
VSAFEEWQAQGWWQEVSKVSSLFRLRHKDSIWLLVVTIVAVMLSYGTLCVKGASDASASVGEADVAIRQAFNATLDAERAGANVSGLIVRLNEAGSVLVEAEIALGNGNSNEAFSKAGQCVEIAGSVKSDADVLRASALDEAQTVFWTYLISSVVGVAVFVVVLALVWRRFKHSHIGKVFGMGPEVAHDEA